MRLTPNAVPVGGQVVLLVTRPPGGQYPNACVAWVRNEPEGRGFRRVWITQPVAFHGKRGMPAWLTTGLLAVQAHLAASTAPVPLSVLADVAYGAHPRHAAKRTR